MADMTLLVDRKGAQVELNHSQVVIVRYGSDDTQRVGLRVLRRILLHGDVQISSRLLRACADEGIAVLFISNRGRQRTMHLFPNHPRQVHMRHAQHLCYADAKQRLTLAAQMVQEKIIQQERCLHTLGIAADLSRFTQKARHAGTVASLLGVEGASSARYFSLWRQAWDLPWKFPGRNRRPPRDPVNALLSLGYTIAMGYAGNMAAYKGLDPALGFLHSMQNGRPSLALDLVEPLRPWVDQWVWTFLNTNLSVTPAHFSNHAKFGCRLNKEGRSTFYAAWHETKDDWLKPVARDSLALLLKGIRMSLLQNS